MGRGKGASLGKRVPGRSPLKPKGPVSKTEGEREARRREGGRREGARSAAKRTK